MDSPSPQTAPQRSTAATPGRAADEPPADSVNLSELPPGALEKLRPVARLALAGEIVRAYVRVRWWLARRDINGAIAALRQTPAGTAASEYSPVVHVAAARLGWAVRRTLRWVPTDSRCLMQSLVLTTLLSARSIDSSLVIGVSPTPTPKFEAHAWVEYCGRPLLPDDRDFYERLTVL